jgi:hypothetical protein
MGALATTPAPASPADHLTAELARLDALRSPAVERQPFTLTTEQFLGLRPMRAVDRNVFLGTFAHAWEYEQRRRIYWRGAPFLMPITAEHQLVAEWPAIRGEREAEAQAVFAEMNRSIAA